MRQKGGESINKTTLNSFAFAQVMQENGER